MGNRCVAIQVHRWTARTSSSIFQCEGRSPRPGPPIGQTAMTRERFRLIHGQSGHAQAASLSTPGHPISGSGSYGFLALPSWNIVSKPFIAGGRLNVKGVVEKSAEILLRDQLVVADRGNAFNPEGSEAERGYQADGRPRTPGRPVPRRRETDRPIGQSPGPEPSLLGPAPLQDTQSCS